MPTELPPPCYPSGYASSDTGPPSAVDFRLIDRARRLFEEVFPAEVLPATWNHGNRTFSIHDYLGFMLLALHVPTCDSLRGLCSASELETFRRRYDCQRMNLGSVSKSQSHVPEELLLPLYHPAWRGGAAAVPATLSYPDRRRIRGGANREIPSARVGQQRFQGASRDGLGALRRRSKAQ